MGGQVINVYPNPWLSRDHNGLPDARVHVDRDGHIDVAEFVGCKLDMDRTKITELPKPTEFRNARQITFWTFCGVGSDMLAKRGPEALLEQPPVPIPRTDYYLRRIMRKELVLADEASAAVCGVRFVPPAEILCVFSGHDPTKIAPTKWLAKPKNASPEEQAS